MRNLKALFAAGDPLLPKKLLRLQKYEPILWKKTVSEIELTSLPEDPLGTALCKTHKK